MTPAQTFLVSISLALISAISFIAYKHPKSYARIWKWLNGLILASWVLYSAGQIIYSSGFSDGKFKTAELNRAKYPTIYLEIPDSPKMRGDWDFVPLLAVVYFSLLSALPDLGITGEKKD
ncbi:MAG: hypothetical protein M3N48_02465 [Verrucomicrobiota bacterium]|nr:hypothetical protein [Verrucomicrobiota bacterium]